MAAKEKFTKEEKRASGSRSPQAKDGVPDRPKTTGRRKTSDRPKAKRPKSKERSPPKAGAKERAAKKADAGARLGPLLSPDSLLDIKVESKDELLMALAETVAGATGHPSSEEIFRTAREREAVVNTYVGEGVAVPHARVPSFKGFAIAIARNRDGFPYGVDTDEPVRIVIFLVGNDEQQHEHVRLLAAIASAIKDKAVREEILESPDSAAVARVLDGETQAPRRRPEQITRLLLSHARKIASGVGATAVIVSIDNREELTILKKLPRLDSFIVATRSTRVAEAADKLVKRVIRLPGTVLGQSTLVRLAALMGVTKGFVSRDDVVAFLSGKPDGNLDTITVLNIWKEFGRFLNASGEISEQIMPGVLERVLILASELAVEGREGRAIGSIFVIGNPEELAPYCQQLVINPFRGYPAEERNILDPTLRETVKEFASIDGAFVVQGDGVLASAGTYLRPGDVDVELPGGYGTRHQAACAITSVSGSVAVALSASTGNLVLFKRGAVVLATERSQA